jgi:hypothetical protein
LPSPLAAIHPFHRQIPLPGFRKNAQSLRPFRAPSSFQKVCFRPQSGNLFRHRNVDELVQRHPSISAAFRNSSINEGCKRSAKLLRLMVFS